MSGVVSVMGIGAKDMTPAQHALFVLFVLSAAVASYVQNAFGLVLLGLVCLRQVAPPADVQML